MISIRRRLILGTVLAVAASSALAGVAAWLSVRTHLLASADGKLRQEAQWALSQVRCRGSDVHWAGGAMPAQLEWLLIADASGQTLLRLPEQAGDLAGLPEGPGCLPDGNPGRIVRIQGPGTMAGRGRGMHRETDAATPTLILTLGRSDAGLHATLGTVAWALAGATAVATALAGLAAAAVARSVLRPVERIAGAIATATPEDACIAVQSASVPLELRPVVERADAFLAAARTQVERERRTAADIAHELRTPLAGLIATADLALARERSPADYRTALERGRGIAQDTARVVEQLLLLTRLESGREPARREPLDLAAALAAWSDTAPAVDTARVDGLPDALSIHAHGDPDHLATVLRNLLGNAIAHAPANARISVQCLTEDQTIRLQIANPAPGRSADDLPHLGEAFWRGDQARAGTGQHAGLGLALSRRLCQLNCWTLSFAIADGNFTASLSLPVQPSHLRCST
jgi:two-component system heavy metal sensor histidine kinase CusS